MTSSNSGASMPDHGALDVLDELVDDLVGADLHVVDLGQLAGTPIGPDVEADDGGVGGGREGHVVLGDATDGPVDERQLDLVALQLAEALGHRLERALGVGLEHQVERGGLAPLDLLEDVLELGARCRWPTRSGAGRRRGSAAPAARRCRGPSWPCR